MHFVDEGTDTGPIILQKAVEVQEGDTPETPAAPCHGTGRVEDYATGDRPDRKWKSDGDGQNRTYQ